MALNASSSWTVSSYDRHAIPIAIVNYRNIIRLILTWYRVVLLTNQNVAIFTNIDNNMSFRSRKQVVNF